jgi:TPR repeat protein
LSATLRLNDLGHPQAQFFLGTLLSKGQHIPEDKKRAFELFVTAAKSGLASAQFNAGHCYFLGKGVGQDFSKAAEYFQLAAEQGFTFAQVNLGNMYSDGLGVPKDLEKAKHYLRMAAPFNAHAKMILQEILDVESGNKLSSATGGKPTTEENPTKGDQKPSCMIQ